MPLLIRFLLLAAAMPSPVVAWGAAPPGSRPPRPAAAPLDIRLDERTETVVVEGRRRFVPAPLPGAASAPGPSATAIFDPKTGASIGEFGWAYVLAAP